MKNNKSVLNLFHKLQLHILSFETDHGKLQQNSCAKKNGHFTENEAKDL